ncbi:unnamed protein product [Paramecium sonneborni]|uniref:Uncharacterized protein n=1 Tax=Paramecium sonneborni TaxID=65129 RepID=A0A8S1RIZ7_9CILI|nr:unnamed protein product [Paramecium sonneborni]
MNNIISMERNRPIKYPSNDVSINWPSFQSCNISQQRLHLVQDLIITHSIGKYSDTESEKNEIPQNLIKLSELQYYHQEYDRNQILQKNENFWITKFIFSDLIKSILLALSFILPYSYIDDSKYKSTQTKIIITFLILTLYMISIILKLYSQMLKHQLMQKSLKQVIYLIVFTISTFFEDASVYALMSIYLFVMNFGIIRKFLQIFSHLNYEQVNYIQMISCIYFSIHQFGCLWIVEQNIKNLENISYLDSIYHSFIISLLQIQEIEIENKLLIILNLTFNVGIIFYILKCLLKNFTEGSRNQQLLKSFRLYLQSKLISFQSKLVLIHYSTIYTEQEDDLTLKKQQRINKIQQYLKWKIINQELSKLNFLSQNTIDLISQSGKLIQSQPLNRLNTDINGLYIILSGSIYVEFMGFQVGQSSQKIIELSLIEIISGQQQGRIRLEQTYAREVLYFFIEKQVIIDILKQSKEQEVYQMIKDDLILYNDTTKLNFRCYFCDQFHPSFNCSSFNIKRRFNYDQIYQERDPRYQRKVTKKSRSAIYQQITYQGTSNINVFEQNSDSFEAFSANSSEHISCGNNGIEQIPKQASTKYIYKEILQADIISDKLTEPMISSTFLKNLTISPDTVIKRQITTTNQNQGQFQDLDSIFDIDKMGEFREYKTKFNITNIITLLNKKNN